jgi:hypothetical protein
LPELAVRGIVNMGVNAAVDVVVRLPDSDTGRPVTLEHVVEVYPVVFVRDIADTNWFAEQVVERSLTLNWLVVIAPVTLFIPTI